MTPIPPLREPGALEELAGHGVTEVWRHSIVTLLGVVDDLDRQLAPLEREPRRLARADGRVAFEAEDLGMVHQPVDHRRGDHLVAEDPPQAEKALL